MTHIDTTVKYTAAKAVVGAVATAVLAFLTALSVVLTGDATIVDVTQAQWVTIAIAVLLSSGVTGGAVYQTTNKPIH